MGGYISSYEQLIINLLSSIIFHLTYNNMSRGQILPYAHMNLHSHDNTNDVFLVSILPRGWSGGNLMPALLPSLSIRVGWGWGCGWLGPPLSFVHANAWVGAGGKGQPLHMTTLYLSYVLTSQFPGPFIPNLNPYPTRTVIALANIKFAPCPYPPSWVRLRLDGLLVLLLTEVLEGWDCPGCK
jgi:hypothetical protein